jgi:hypothetical protein
MRRLARAAVTVTALLVLVSPAIGAVAFPGRPIPGGSIQLRDRSPLSPVLVVHRHGRTTYVKLTPAKSPGVCSVVHWHVSWPFVTVVAQPSENHGGRFDCRTDVDTSVIWVVDFSQSIAHPVIYAAGLDYPLG